MCTKQSENTLRLKECGQMREREGQERVMKKEKQGLCGEKPQEK